MCPTVPANACERKGCSDCLSASTTCSFCGFLDPSASGTYGFCVNGKGACKNNDTVTSLATCNAIVTNLTSVCESLSCSECAVDYSCTWCGGATNGSCVTGVCPVDNPLLSSFNASMCPSNKCDSLSCNQCITTTGCSFCGSTANSYGFCVAGTSACTHNDAVTDAAGCAALANAQTSVCEVLSCSQCMNTLACTWCGGYNNGTCVTSTNNCPTGADAVNFNSTLCPINTCETQSCNSCIGKSGCAFCGSADPVNPYGFCVIGNSSTCVHNDVVSTSAQCANVTAATTTICESLSCSQCLSTEVEFACSWCGGFNNGSCVTGFCPGSLTSQFNASLCPAPAAGACETLSCDDCVKSSSCSFCGSATQFYGFCVNGAGACTHNDSITTSAQCAALKAAETTICESLSCSQCIGAGPCHFCGSGATGHCSTLGCGAGLVEQFNVSVCPVVQPGACELLDCASCSANPACSNCGATGSSGYQYCVNGTNACPANQTVNATVCSAIVLASQTICESLGCHQCFADQGQFCSWCVDRSGMGKCVTGFQCLGGIVPSSNVSVCPPATTCQKSSCTDCIAASTTCSFCADTEAGYAFCIDGPNKCTHNDTVTNATTCANITQSITTICEALSCNQCIDGVYANFACNYCGTGLTGACQSQFCDSEPQQFNSSVCPAINAGACESLACGDCIKNPKCSFCADTTAGYGFCVDGAGKCTHNDAFTTAADCAKLPLDICPLLSCNQCVNEFSCNYCSSASAHPATKCTAQYCDGTYQSLSDNTTCAAANVCEKLSCAACVANPACSYCADQNGGFQYCVLGSNKCGSSQITSATQCAQLNPPPPPPSGTTVVGTTRGGSSTASTTNGGNGSGATTTTTTTAAGGSGGTTTPATAMSVTKAGAGAASLLLSFAAIVVAAFVVAF